MQGNYLRRSGLVTELLNGCWIRFIAFVLFPCFSFHCLALAGKCGILAPPSNSFVSYNPPERTDQGTARYACLPGYERFGDAERKCVDGQWAGQAPLCAINIAIRQNAQQSSNATEYTVLRGSRQGYEAAAYLAVDGTKLYCSKTNMEAQSYWHVTFVKAYNVVAVRIYGDLLPDIDDVEVSLSPITDSLKKIRSDLQTLTDKEGRYKENEKTICRLSSAELANNTANPITGSEGDPVRENVLLFVCSSNANVSARQVVIKRRSYAALRLCEVEVFSQQGVPCQHPGSPVNGIVKLSQVEWPFPPGAVAVYDCNAGYVRFPTDNAYHRTCQINGTWDVQEPVCVTNVAIYRPANLSSLFSVYSYPAWQGVDGDTNSCAWSRREREPWLQIDLMMTYNIHAVSVLLDKDRLFYQFHRNLFVSVSNRSDDMMHRLGAPSTFRRSMIKDVAPGSGIFYLDAPVRGRYITLFVVGNLEKFLGICDLQVLADDELPASTDNCGLQTPSTSFLYTYKKTCYQVQRFTSTNWYNAAVSCQDNGGSLITAPDYDTNLFLTNMLSNLYRFHTSDDRYWIGAKLFKGGDQWMFVVENATSPVRSAFWAPGRPSNTGQADYESCAALGGHGASNWSWTDYRCDQDSASWICSYSPKSCGDPVQPEASALLVSDKIIGLTGWKIGDHVQYECAPGYLLIGSVETVCQPDGSWSGGAPICQFVSCGDPPKRSHLYHSLLNGTTFYGSFVQYYCLDDASKLMGGNVVRCLDTGQWQTVDALCETMFLKALPLDSAVIVPDEAALVHTADASPSVNLGGTHPDVVGVGVGVAVSAALFLLIAAFCGVRYRRNKQAQHAASPVKKRTSPYSTIRRLQTHQISGPIAIMQTTNEPPKISASAGEYDLTPQPSVSLSDDIHPSSRSDPEGSISPSASVPSESSTNYLKSFGKAGMMSLYKRAKNNETLRGLRSGDSVSQRERERPRVPRLVISSPIECRKTIVLDSGTQYARTGTEVIYAQPGKLNGTKVSENQYEYLETAKVRGGYGNPMEGIQRGNGDEDGIYTDTSLRIYSKENGPDRDGNDDVYDDVRNHHNGDSNNNLEGRYIR